MFVLPELPYTYNALEPFIDEETMHVHHDGHHAIYVKNLNDVLTGHDEFLNMDIEELLRSLDKIPEDIRTKVKNNAGGHFHHSLFWTIMKQGGGGEPTGEVSKLINETFGDFNSFKEKFNTSALGVFGSGWTWLLLDDGELSIENTSNQDSPISVGKYPLFAIDLWEHAYYLKYKNKRADFIEAWWNVINWDEVEKRFNKRRSF
jgi:superoxide dismutase, Fe-Mn family